MPTSTARLLTCSSPGARTTGSRAAMTRSGPARPAPPGPSAAARARTGPSLTRSPRNGGPGAGRRACSPARAGRRRAPAAPSAPAPRRCVSLGARLTPSDGCGTACSGAVGEAVHRRDEQARRRRAASRSSSDAGGVVGAHRLGERAEHGPGVEALLEEERRGAGDVVAGHDGALHRRGSAPGGQQREVEVDPAVRAARRARPGARGRRTPRPGSSPGPAAPSRSRNVGVARRRRASAPRGRARAPPA